MEWNQQTSYWRNGNGDKWSVDGMESMGRRPPQFTCELKYGLGGCSAHKRKEAKTARGQRKSNNSLASPAPAMNCGIALVGHSHLPRRCWRLGLVRSLLSLRSAPSIISLLTAAHASISALRSLSIHTLLSFISIDFIGFVCLFSSLCGAMAGAPPITPHNSKTTNPISSISIQRS